MDVCRLRGVVEMRVSFLLWLALAFLWGLWCSLHTDGYITFIVTGLGALVMGFIYSALERRSE